MRETDEEAGFVLHRRSAGRPRALLMLSSTSSCDTIDKGGSLNPGGGCLAPCDGCHRLARCSASFDAAASLEGPGCRADAMPEVAAPAVPAVASSLGLYSPLLSSSSGKA
eukprot:scaffold327843_cov58-Tisochrysis_lutea.AAC.1